MVNVQGYNAGVWAAGRFMEIGQEEGDGLITPAYLIGFLAGLTVVVEAAFPGADLHQILTAAQGTIKVD